MPQGFGECALDRVSSTPIADFAENFSPEVCGSSFNLRNSSSSGSSHRNRESADSPRASETAESDARTAPPGRSGAKILLAQASTPEQSSRARNRTRGRVFLFPPNDNFWRDHNALTPPRKEICHSAKMKSHSKQKQHSKTSTATSRIWCNPRLRADS